GFHVTGVQTCALPICCSAHRHCSYSLPMAKNGKISALLAKPTLRVSSNACAKPTAESRLAPSLLEGRVLPLASQQANGNAIAARSEERREGKKSRSRR